MSAKFSSAKVLSLIAVAGCLFGSAVHAATTWNFGNASNCTQVAGTVDVSSNYTGDTYGNSWTCNATTPKVTATAWSAWPTTDVTDTFAAAWLPIWDGNGFGVLNGSGDQHSLDNYGKTDLILFDFGNYSVDLSEVTVGWAQNDSDISLLRYTGTNAPSVEGLAVAQGRSDGKGLLDNGWELVGNYANLAEDAPTTVNSLNKTSSWWIISAYNASYKSGTDDNLCESSCGSSDYLKIFAIAGDATLKTQPPTGVPEPGSLALMGIAMAGVVASRRRKQQAA